MKKVIRVGVIGFGTVGAGVAKILIKQKKLLSERAGCFLELAKVADLKFKTIKGFSLPASMKTNNAYEIINDPAINIIVEVVGGVNPARQFILDALKNGKHVVTSNKEVIAKHGPEFAKAAKQHNVNIFFEAAVGGGIPIIHSLKKCLAANNILALYGIVNGTTNYILSKMEKEGRSFDAILKEAQALGYAEADPTADVDGWDAAYKLSILAKAAFHTYVPHTQIYFEGIRKVSARDIQFAQDFGYTIKLLAIGKNSNGRLVLKVHPVMIAKDHPLAAVNDSFNAIYVVGDAVGETMFYGRGAGELPTASAVVGDIIDLAMHNACMKTEPEVNDKSSKKIVPVGETMSEFFIRLSVKDQPGVLAAISSVFGKNKVSIKIVNQHDTVKRIAELVIVTHSVKESAFKKAISRVAKLGAVKKVESIIRVGLDAGV